MLLFKSSTGILGSWPNFDDKEEDDEGLVLQEEEEEEEGGVIGEEWINEVFDSIFLPFE